ncbi:MAG: hypothetical protein LBU65_04120 [Planctomycetaceae bacterium]|jgi:hypothetical protein|nr:hypothetical protein [Planctomycetaceae bacterium]
MHDRPWQTIFEKYAIDQHDFSESPFQLSARQIKQATNHFTTTSEREIRIICKQDTRESRPEVFVKNDLFLLPTKNGEFIIIEGEGYVDMPELTNPIIEYDSKLDFELESSKVGNSEMQHLDYAYASSIIRTFLDDPTLVLTIRGRKYTPKFDFIAGRYSHKISTGGVQTEVDAGYEGREQIALVEAKNSETKNTIIRQLYYPYRQWKSCTNKPVKILFFEKREMIYSVWLFEFNDVNNYNSISFVGGTRYKLL